MEKFVSLNDFDGGFIITTWEQYPEVVKWYKKHFELDSTFEEDFLDSRMTSLQFPSIGAIHIKAVNTGKKHFSVDRDVYGNTRFSLIAADLMAVHRYFAEQQARIGEVSTGPEGKLYFDLYDPWGTRLDDRRGRPF